MALRNRDGVGVAEGLIRPNPPFPLPFILVVDGTVNMSSGFVLPVFGVGHQSSSPLFLLLPGALNFSNVAPFLGVSGSVFSLRDRAFSLASASEISERDGKVQPPKSSSSFLTGSAAHLLLASMCPSMVLLSDVIASPVDIASIAAAGSERELLITAAFSLSAASSSHRKNLQPPPSLDS